MSRLLGRLRLLFGFCQLGAYGCNRRPVGTWDLDGGRFRFCAQCWDELRGELADDKGEVLGHWSLDGAA